MLDQLNLISYWILQASDGGGQGAPAGDGAAPRAQNSPFDFLLPIIIIFFIFWILLIRPESRKRKDREKKVQALKKGDQVITNGGILGKVHKVEDKYIVVQVDKDKDVRVRFLKSSIFDVVPAGEPEPASTT